MRRFISKSDATSSLHEIAALVEPRRLMVNTLSGRSYLIIDVITTHIRRATLVFVVHQNHEF